MKHFAYVVLSNPVPGREDEYNHWYTGQHLNDVIAVPGFVSAQRYRLHDVKAEGAPQQRYMAIYNLRTDDPEALIAKLTALVESGSVPMSDSFSHEGVSTILYEAITPLVLKAASGDQI
jgi:hypothetical protein